MNEKLQKTEAYNLLASLAEETRRLVDASGIESGSGGGWNEYDGTMTELRKRLAEAERYINEYERH